jgi:hypothetical protein
VSWDVLFQDLPDGVTCLDDIPADFQPTKPLGTHADVLAKLRSAAPGVDFSDPTWGVLGGNGFSIEFNVGNEEPVMALMLHVRGMNEERVFAILRDVALALDRQAIDCSAGTLLDFSADDVAAGFQAWRRYRDRIVGTSD